MTYSSVAIGGQLFYIARMRNAPSQTSVSHEFEVMTSCGIVRGTDTKYGSKTILFLHGNSFGRSVFDKQFESVLATHYRLVSIDLPGHGQSDNLDHGEYSLSEMTKVVLEVANELSLGRFAIVGWSLGGHIALELAAVSGDVSALLLCGTAPMHRGTHHALIANKLSRTILLAGQKKLNPRQRKRFVDVCFPGDYNDTWLDYVARADPRVRKEMTKSILKGKGTNQRDFIESTSMPVCVVNGSDEPFVRLSYLNRLKIRNLCQGRALQIEGGGHTPFQSHSDEFNNIVHNFMRSTL
jgi:pimeloyl-ACP methyl ester carboxylesterase